jgi:hypothetical protein
MKTTIAILAIAFLAVTPAAAKSLARVNMRLGTRQKEFTDTRIGRQATTT